MGPRIMPDATWTCQCGARHRVPPAPAGSKIKCKKCGHVGALPYSKPIPLDDDTIAPPEPPPNRPGDLDVIIEESEREPPPPLHRTSFGSDVFYSFVFFIEPGSLVALGILWFFTMLAAGFLWMARRLVFGIVMILPIALAIAGVLVFGWLCSYYMRIVNEVADDEDELPSTVMGGAFESILKPLFVFVATWVCLLLPAFVMAFAQARWNLNIPTVWMRAAVVLAVVMWPMAVLCVSIGGITVFLRADLMIYSVLRTLGPYTIVWLLLLATGVGGYYLIDLTTAGAATGTSLLSRHFLAGVALLSMIITYGSIVAMRVIGLYYRHFKHRFAWSWE